MVCCLNLRVPARLVERFIKSLYSARLFYLQAIISGLAFFSVDKFVANLKVFYKTEKIKVCLLLQDGKGCT